MSYNEVKSQINNFLDQINITTGNSNRIILSRCCSQELQRAEIRSNIVFETELNRGAIDIRILEAIRDKLEAESLRHQTNTGGGKKRIHKRKTKRKTKRNKGKKSKKSRRRH